VGRRVGHRVGCVRAGSCWGARRAASDTTQAASLPPPHPHTHPNTTPAPPGELTLVAPRVPEDVAIWSGPLPSIDEVAAAAGADHALYYDDLGARLTRLNGRTGGALLHALEGAGGGGGRAEGYERLSGQGAGEEPVEEDPR